MNSTIKIFSLNVNRYDDNTHNYLTIYIQKHSPTIIFLSETKRYSSDLQKYFSSFKDYTYIINQHIPFQYHGVAMLIHKKVKYKQVDPIFNIIPRYDTKHKDPTTGRVISIKIKDKNTYILGTYTPNSGVNGLKNLSYRIEKWDVALFSELNYYDIEKDSKVMLIGDLNVAPEEIDVSNPEYMYQWPGYTPEERKNFKTFLEDGWVDIWRETHKDIKEYSWYGDGKGRKKRTFGMRLDSIICNKELSKFVIDTDILTEVDVSDHVPVIASFNI